MPKLNTDYSNTIVYKITCKTPSVCQYFVGHTTGTLAQKKRTMKQICNDPKKKEHNNSMYKTIREHGGWDNWEFTELGKYNCVNENDAYIKECEHKIELEQENFDKFEKIQKKKDEDRRKKELEFTNQVLSNDSNIRQPDFSVSLHSRADLNPDESNEDEIILNMNEITERDLSLLTTLVLKLINQNMFFKEVIIRQNDKIDELSKELGLPVDEI
jgi:hypothetical protein